MKKKTFIKFLVIALVLSPTSQLFAGEKKALQKTDTAVSNDVISTFQATNAWKKLDGRTQKVWLDAMKQGDTDRRLDCFVRVQWPADDGDQSFLISKGFIVRFFSGTVASGHMKAKDMPDVAGLPFVSTVKLSTKNQ